MTGTGYPLPPQPLYYPPPPPPGFGYQYRYAGVLQRFGAVLIDSILLIIVAVLIAIPIGILAVASWLAFG
ncbi:MAG TPA: hypothetical protein VJS68_03870, partial [Thermoplasmata archaeon]|nr:hypothetical protein [Thermoplasmata archaeon]